MAEKHWLSNQGALEEERRKEEVFVERTASRISRKELLKTVRRKIGVRERKRIEGILRERGYERIFIKF